MSPFLTSVLFVFFVGLAYAGIFGFLAAIGSVVRDRNFMSMLDVIVFGAVTIFGISGLVGVLLP